MAYSVSASNESPFKSDERIAQLRQEVADYQKCILGNYHRLMALTHISGADGGILDPESCVRLPPGKIQEILHGLVERLLIGLPIKGGYNAWSIGGFGSRWIDLDPLDFGAKGDVSHIRCAFYSRMSTPGKWRPEKPYAIAVTVEKARR